MSVGIIGCGDISRLHFEAWQALGEAGRVVMLADVDQERLRQRSQAWNVPDTTTDHRRLLARDDIRIVSICTPPMLHYPIIMDSLAAGKWVLCEKPLVGSLADFDRVSEQEARTGCYCASVFQIRWGVALRRLREQMAAGTLGRLYLAEMRVQWMRDDAYYKVPWRGKWANELGGTLMSHGIHGLDAMLDLIGPVREVHMMADHLARRIECEDTLVANLRAESGAMFSMIVTVLDQDNRSHYRLLFEHASVDSGDCPVYEPTSVPWTYATKEGSPLRGREAELAGASVPGTGIHANQIADFVRSFARKERPAASGPSLRRTLEVVTALYKSALTGERVRLPIGKDDRFYQAMHGGRAF